MRKLAVGLVTILIAACATPQKAQPQILSIVPAEKQVTVDTNEPDSYLVRVNFVLFAQEIVNNPQAAEAFEAALREWASHLPIQCGIFIEDSGIFSFLPFGPSMVSEECGVIRVHIADTVAPPYNRPKRVLGYWDWNTNTLVLNQNAEATNMYSIALHELGHVFGLPHFLNQNDDDIDTGSYVIPNTYDADKMIMFPILSEVNQCSQLTKLEIALAQKNILTLQQVGRTNCFYLTAR